MYHDVSAPISLQHRHQPSDISHHTGGVAVCSGNRLPSAGRSELPAAAAAGKRLTGNTHTRLSRVLELGSRSRGAGQRDARLAALAATLAAGYWPLAALQKKMKHHLSSGGGVRVIGILRRMRYVRFFLSSDIASLGKQKL